MSIGGRFAIIFSVLVWLATATVGILVYRGSKDHLIQASTDRLQHTATVARVRLNSSVETIGSDARFLAATPPVEGLVRIWTARERGIQLDPVTAISDREWRGQLAEIFGVFLENRPSYFRVSFAGLTDRGREFVGVDKRNEQIVRVTSTELRYLSDHYSYEDAINQARGEVFISEIRPNADTSDITRYGVPILRASTPVFTTNGDVFGLITIDVDMRETFETLREQAGNERTLYLANERGEFLTRSDLGPGYDYERDKAYLLQDIFPDAEPVVLGDAFSTRIEETQSASGVPVSAYFERVELGLGAFRHPLVIGVTSPHEQILAAVTQLRNRSILITFLFSFAGIALVLAFSRYLLDPLSQVTRALSRFGSEDLGEDLPLDRTDEIGVLARTYVAMSEKIQEQVVKLENEERRQRAILQTSAEGIIVTDSLGTVEAFNPAAEHILGYTAAEAIGRNVDEMIEPLRDGNGSLVAPSGEDDHIWTRMARGGEADGRRSDGQPVPLMVTWSGFDLNGEKKYTFFLQDISERKQAEQVREQLVEALDKERLRLKRLSETLEERVKQRTLDLVRINRALGQRNRELQDFAFVASHDLQEPLRKIRSFADLLKMEHGDKLDSEAQFYVDRMYESADRMSRLISDLLAFSSVTATDQPSESIDLRLVAQDVLSGLRASIVETGAEVMLGDLPVVEAYPSQIRQLLHHLVENALKFRRPNVHPVVRVYSLPEDECAQSGGEGVCCIVVEDNGMGFDEKYLDRIFSPFQRLHGSDDYEGTGMGLSICRRIVERHDGVITASSVPGKGSKFIVRLPLNQHQDDVVLQKEQ